MATTPGTTKTRAKAKPKAKPSGARKGFRPPNQIPRADVVRTSRAVIRRKDIPMVESEDIFRIKTLGMDWDMGLRIYTPRAKARIARGADRKRVGIFLLHGGSGDFKSMEVIARLFAGKFGFKVAVMTFPGRLYLDAKSRDWPGDTANEDGTVRTPIWQKGEHVTPDQYTLVPALHGPNRGKGAPIYLYENGELVSTIMAKEELGLEKFQHIHNAVLRKVNGKLYVLAQAWNPGDFAVFEQVGN